MKDETSDETFDEIIERGIATESEVQLVTCINGYNLETLNDIIYARTGYRDLEQLKES
jgi:hypothetical protein